MFTVIRIVSGDSYYTDTEIAEVKAAIAGGGYVEMPYAHIVYADGTRTKSAGRQSEPAMIATAHVTGVFTIDRYN
jgi:hypothetical protein